MSTPETLSRSQTPFKSMIEKGLHVLTRRGDHLPLTGSGGEGKTVGVSHSTPSSPVTEKANFSLSNRENDSIDKYRLRCVSLEKEIVELKKELREYRRKEEDDISRVPVDRESEDQKEIVVRCMREIKCIKEALAKNQVEAGRKTESYSDESTDESYEELCAINQARDGDKSPKSSFYGNRNFDSRMGQKYEALKILRSLIPNELDDAHAGSWVDDAADGVRQYFPLLGESDIIELLVKRLPKRHLGVTRGMQSCKSLSDFKVRVLGLCTNTYTKGFDSITHFLNFAPRKVGVNTIDFKELVLEILNEAEPMFSLSSAEYSEEMKRRYVLEKLYQYLPYSIQDKIIAQDLHKSGTPMLDDLNPFICDPKMNREVIRHLRTIKAEPKVKVVGSVDGGQTNNTDGKKKWYRPKNSCVRCGSALHKSENCTWYTVRVNDYCKPCLEATNVRLYHAEEQCIQSPK